MSAADVVLAIEASQREAAVALLDARGDAGAPALDAEPLRTTRKHDEDLMPAIDRVCARAGVRPGELDLVAVSIGPGGFTGLRIAVVTAKMLAMTTGCAVLGVPSALVTAASTPVDAGPGATDEPVVLVVLGSKRDHAWTSRVRGTGIEDVEEVPPPPAWGPADDVDLSDVRALLADAHAPAGLVERARSSGIPVIEPRLDAGVLAHLARRRLRERGPDDPHALVPLYGREPEAVSRWRARHPGTA